MGYQARGTSGMTPNLSLRDLHEIREVVQECISLFIEQVKPEEHAPEPEYLTTREVAEITKYSKAALEAYRGKNDGPPFYKQGANVRYRSDEVRNWMEEKRYE